MSTRVACLGPEGTVSQEALYSVAGSASLDVRLESSIHGVIAALSAGEADFALVPLENSLEGGVTETLDELLAGGGMTPIRGELLHPVRHSLITARKLELSEISEVLSKQEAIAQCAEFLARELPNARITAAASTADAVKTISHSEAPLAALGTAMAAELYGCQVLVNDAGGDGNVTRFVWLSADPNSDLPPGCDPDRPYRTSIVFWGSGASEPGWLVECLAEFGNRSVNLSRIESRPRRKGLGSYVFFADVEGNIEDGKVKEAIAGLTTRADEVRMLGSYPSSVPQEA